LLVAGGIISWTRSGDDSIGITDSSVVERCPEGTSEANMSRPLSGSGTAPWTAYVAFPGKIAHQEVIVASDIPVDSVNPRVTVCVRPEPNVTPLRIVARKAAP